MKVIDDDDASLLPKIGADEFPLGGTVTRARDYNNILCRRDAEGLLLGGQPAG